MLRSQLELLESREVPATFTLGGGELLIEANLTLGTAATVNPGSAPEVVVVTWEDGGGSPSSKTFTGIKVIDFAAGIGGLNEFVDNTSCNDIFAGGHSRDNIYYGGSGSNQVGTGVGYNFIETRSATQAEVLILGSTGYGEILSEGVHTVIKGNETGYEISDP